MIDGHLCHAPHFHYEEIWEEAFQLAKESNVLRARSSVDLESAAWVMNIRKPAETPTELSDVGHDAHTPRPCAFSSPSNDGIVPFFQFCKERRKICRIILQIGVDCGDNVPRRMIDTCLDCSAFG